MGEGYIWNLNLQSLSFEQLCLLAIVFILFFRLIIIDLFRRGI